MLVPFKDIKMYFSWLRVAILDNFFTENKICFTNQFWNIYRIPGRRLQNTDYFVENCNHFDELSFDNMKDIGPTRKHFWNEQISDLSASKRKFSALLA